MLIQVCGLPGTGKTTLSAALGDALRATVLRIDAIEAAMWRNKLPREATGIAAYSVAHAIALPNLRRGVTVVADAVSAIAAARNGWAGTAADAGVPLVVIETVCPDESEHRRRIETRVSDLEGFTVPDWDYVHRTMTEYEPRTDTDRLVIDTRRPFGECLSEALARIRAAAPAA